MTTYNDLDTPSRALWESALKAFPTIDVDELTAVFQAISRLETYSRFACLAEAIQYVAPHRTTRPLLCIANGTCDGKTGGLAQFIRCHQADAHRHQPILDRVAKIQAEMDRV